MGRRENSGSRVRKGPTLNEILSAMAILALIAVILLPNVQGCGRRRGSRSVKAVSEIRTIDLGITKLLSDAGKPSLRDLFDERAFNESVAQLGRSRSMDAFEASVEIYTHETYVLLRKGRHALEVPNDYGDTLNADIVGGLADAYLTELAFDPWGNLYQVFVGPWPDTMGPVLFRNYMTYGPEQARLPGDTDIPNAADQLLMEGLDYETGDPIQFGYPADARETSIYGPSARMVFRASPTTTQAINMSRRHNYTIATRCRSPSYAAGAMTSTTGTRTRPTCGSITKVVSRPVKIDFGCHGQAFRA